MPPRKKYTLLNMQQRLAVLKDLREKKLLPAQIAIKYGIEARTLGRIERNATKINAFADKSSREQKRRRLFKPLYNEIEKQLLAWLEQRRTFGYRVTDALILKKATEFKEHLPSYSRFKVSRGWLNKFKRRNGISLVDRNKQKNNVDQIESDAFVNNLKEMIKEENISLENIYNMDESALLWKTVPTKILAGGEKNLWGHETKKELITIGLCANMLGTHKIMPLVIYRYKNPKALRHEVSLPVIFKSQTNASIDRTLFLDWFENHFKPSVKQYQEEKEISGKVILLLDNCEAHNVSLQENEEFKIMYLPTNSRSCISKSMNQERIMEKTKRIFRQKLLQRVLTYDGGISEFYSDYTIKNCIDILSESWSVITQRDIKNASNKIINPASRSIQSETRELEPDWQGMISEITGEQCTLAHVTQFLLKCEEEERYIEDIEIKEEPAELQEEPQEMIYEGCRNEIGNNELRVMFERLTFYSATAPACVQCMVQGIKIFFLGKEN